MTYIILYRLLPSTFVSIGCVAGGGSSETDSRISSSNAAS